MSTPALVRPPEKWIRAFRPSMVGHDTVRSLLKDNFSLVLCCKDCPRMIEWTPPELAERFGARLDLRLAELVPRLICSGDEGCGSHEIAVFPNFWPVEGRSKPQVRQDDG